MSFRSLTVQHDELPWSWPLRLGARVPMHRSRAIITVIDRQGCEHQAELAPCPGVHPESMDEAITFWGRKVLPLLLSTPLLFDKWNWTLPYFGLLDAPAMRFRSVQTAVEQLLLSWAQSQNPEAFTLPEPLSIQGSALLPIQGNSEEGWLDFLSLWEQGHRVLKCKVGRHPAAHEYAFLQKILHHTQGQIQLRLDANRSMSPEDIQFWQEHSNDLPLLYWEEAAGFYPQALDETLWDIEQNFPKAEAWILKPSRLSLSHTVSLLKKAEVEKIPCVLSNAFDSGLSLRCSAWIYAVFCADPQPLGFGTARFLPNDAWQSEAWAAPRVMIPRHPFAMPGDIL